MLPDYGSKYDRILFVKNFVQSIIQKLEPLM